MNGKDSKPRTREPWHQAAAESLMRGAERLPNNLSLILRMKK